jgi:RNA polymerase sigma factor for flagellar operon FliA
MHRAHARYAERGRDPESEVILRHSALIDKCVRILIARTGAHAHEGDLWTAGALGLVDAWRRYEPSSEASFETFASHRVRGAMLDELRKLDHLPRRLRAKSERVAKKRRELGHTLGREPEQAEVAESLEMELSELDAIEAAARPQANVEDHAGSLAWLPSIDDSLSREQQLIKLTAAIRMLPERLQMVLGLRYTEGLTVREIAGLLKVSEPRVSQLHSDAVKRLRDIMSVDDAD